MASSLEKLRNPQSQPFYRLHGLLLVYIKTSSCAGAFHRWIYDGCVNACSLGSPVFAFHLYESPKYLTGKGKDEHAAKVIHRIARHNGKLCKYSRRP